MKVTTIIALGTLLGTSAFVSAQEAPAREGRTPRAPRPPTAEQIKEFDKDGDGKLNDEEKTAADAFKKEADARQAEMIKKFDKDGDGKLSDDEKKAAREAFMKSHGEGKGGHEGKSDKPKEEKK